MNSHRSPRRPCADIPSTTTCCAPTAPSAARAAASPACAPSRRGCAAGSSAVEASLGHRGQDAGDLVDPESPLPVKSTSNASKLVSSQSTWAASSGVTSLRSRS